MNNEQLNTFFFNYKITLRHYVHFTQAKPTSPHIQHTGHHKNTVALNPKYTTDKIFKKNVLFLSLHVRVCVCVRCIDHTQIRNANSRCL